MNQPDAVSKNAMPTFEITLADQMIVKAEWPKAPQRVRPGSASARDEVTSALKRLSPKDKFDRGNGERPTGGWRADDIVTAGAVSHRWRVLAGSWDGNAARRHQRECRANAFTIWLRDQTHISRCGKGYT